MKLLNWQFQCWQFNKDFILYIGTGVMNFFAYCISTKKFE